MQFHDHGYVSGDPRISPAAGTGIDRPIDPPDEVDVLIVGAGPAGVVVAAQLAQFPGIRTRIVERRAGRLEIGQADGIQARSVETFQAFGFADRIIAEAYRITQMAFWKPDRADPARIVRTAMTEDDAAGTSEFPHLIVNQARVLDYSTEFMQNAPARITPDYGIEFRGLTVADAGEYPVTVSLVRTAGERAGEELTVRARYVVGGDGARSAVRAPIGGVLRGDQSFHAWGVMDVLAVTDFPDIRTKCAIQSEAGGSILLIPREGGYLVRMYVDLGEIGPEDNGAVRATTLERIIAHANEILHPYTLDVRHVAWHSVYEVAHRLTDRFDDVLAHEEGERSPRVFIMGDACHTHSAKAGQGMNVSMQDGFNLGWKLAHVLEGRSPEALLSTYSAERQVVAKDLIDFDREWASMMAKRPEEFDDPSDLERFSVQTAEFPAGFMTRYAPSMLIGAPDHQPLAAGFPIGKRFRSPHAVRVADGNPVHLGHHARADGRWRLYAFADEAGTALAAWATWLAESPRSPVVAYTPEGMDLDGVFDVKVIYPRSHLDVSIARVPTVFLPRTGPFGLVDYEKVYARDAADDAFSGRGIGSAGGVVVVRPDQYISTVLPFEVTDALAGFFDGILLPQFARTQVSRAARADAVRAARR